jgi:RNA polymerase sigma factor (TIGR02999 family)
MTEPHSKATVLLRAWRSGDASAMEELRPLVYDRLAWLASRSRSQERQGQTLNSTALVHQAYLKLLSSEVCWEDRVHFMAIAAITMRRILVDHARGSRRAKRGSGAEKVALEDALLSQVPMNLDILALDNAFILRSQYDPRKGRLIELLYFDGLSCKEAAAVVEISTATANWDLKLAKAWLQQELKSVPSHD